MIMIILQWSDPLLNLVPARKQARRGMGKHKRNRISWRVNADDCQ